MVIIHVTPVFPPYRGGIGTVAADYARRLRERGIVVRVFTPEYRKHGNAREEHEGVTRLRPLYAWGNAALVPSLFRKLRSADVIHLHYPFYGGEIFAWLASVVWRKPLMVTYHMKAKAAGWLGMIFRLHRALIEPFILRQAKKIFFSSKEYAYESGVSIGTTVSNETRVSILPFGVDTARFHVGRDDAFRTTHGIPLDATVIIFVGGLDAAHYFKGLDVLLAACTKLRDDSWHLLVVGSGDRRNAFEAQAVALGIAPRVHFVGSVVYEDLPRAYRAADLHVLPSIDRSEAFGIVTLEAAASGLPSVVSDLPGVRSLVVQNATGRCVRPGDTTALAEALADLLQQDGRREVMGAAARAMVEERYDAERLMDILITTYSAV